jgi:tRNA isopentenyl-2-thiomethyl-A-37 hydroxylase MiaE
MLTDKEYRKEIVSNVKDPTVRDFWLVEYASYTDRFAAEAAPAIQNKVGQFIANPLIRNIIGQEKTSFDVRKIMDERKILIVNLSKGKVGEGNANLIGSLLITKIYLAAMSRADASSAELEKLPPFYFYVDEFQNFANDSFASILSEARKYNLALTVAHQYVDQMEDEVKSAVFGNVGTMIVFRVGASDAEIFEKEFAPYFTMDDVVNLSAFQFYLRLMIDGAGSKPFSARSLDPIVQPPHSNAQAVIDYTRATYGKHRFEVEDEITRFYTPKPKEEKKKDTTDKHKEKNEYHATSSHLAEQERTTPRQETHTREAQKARTFTPQEKVVKVRKITDATPLPPKSFPREKRDTAQPSDAYAVSRSVEEAFHKPPVREDKKPHFSVNTKKDSPQPVLEKMSVPREEAFQGTSLKDALKKAMEEHEQETRKERSLFTEEKVVTPTQEPTTSVEKKEVSEDVLRQLLQDD